MNGSVLSTWEIRRYEPSCRQEWDSFIAASRNGTFLFLRGYMDYHANRFRDFSLMAYHGGKLCAVLPAHIDRDVLYSHRGLTYGGVVFDGRMTAWMMMELFGEIIRFVRSSVRAVRWVYHPVPYIYANYPSEEDLYALFRFGGWLVERKISTVIPAGAACRFNTFRRRKYLVNRALREGLTVLQDEDFAAFWSVLENNLRERHQARPVHSLEEILLLHAGFPENIVLHRVCDSDGNTVAGCVMYLTRNVAHVQYIGSTEEGRARGAVDLLFYHLLHEVYADVRYFDMGTSVEEGGRVLNKGLIFQKEGFGGRAVMYDTYEMDLT